MVWVGWHDRGLLADQGGEVEVGEAFAARLKLAHHRRLDEGLQRSASARGTDQLLLDGVGVDHHDHHKVPARQAASDVIVSAREDVTQPRLVDLPAPGAGKQDRPRLALVRVRTAQESSDDLVVQS